MRTGAADPVQEYTLGTARVVPYGMLRPARGLRGVEVAAVASRSRDRARRFAAPTEFRALTRATRACWPIATSTRSTTRSPLVFTASGPCERSKPASTFSARSPLQPMRWRRGRCKRHRGFRGLVLCEAFHSRYHPLAARMKEIVTSGAERHPTRRRAYVRGDSRPSRHSVPAPARWRGHDALRLLRGEHAPVLRGSRTGRCRRAGVVVRARCGPNDGGAFSLSRWKNGCDELPALCSRFASWRISARVVGERGGDEGAQSLRSYRSGLFRHTTRTRGKSASIRSTHSSSPRPL